MKENLNTEELVNSMVNFISESVYETSDQKDYIVIINKDINGIMFYDKRYRILYFDQKTIEKDLDSYFPDYYNKYKKMAMEKYFNKKYPKIKIKKVETSVLG